MKKMLKNKKGFTLVELLAVIVILAIIMVIATQQIGKVIAGARADSFVESYQMVAKQIQTYIISDQTVCTGNSCANDFGLSSDYALTITDMGSNTYKVKLEPGASGSKFENLDLVTYGKNKCSAATSGTISAGQYSADCTTTTIEGTVK